ncbi:FkbM family methyltransferase [Mycobacterium sp. 852002-51057_SCH5723018]|uniref:FkbM family methyltransferase n=1 Tax=Mycobacterium sp. 852002-51057_SCH5723018 TaxID=1834094 RepID=UPI0007FECE71|nr:FkbM family methyltransferase [Mycobacterium sp. 852002-51057_SCH5723018]OBG25085.1 FkbM family methyltransferase [Mycobacterium sp. 852002-51057_SCH5723018]
MSTSLHDLLSPQRLTEIVDVGANPIDGDPPYSTMLAAKLCRVTGFEPQPEALQKLEAMRGLNEVYLPYAVGDGAEHTLTVCRGSGMTSLFEPDPDTLNLFEYLKLLATVVDRVPVHSRKLDDITEIQHVDFLKIDAQGSELAVMQSGATKLAEAVVVQAEVSFVTLYREQPCLGEVDLELRAQGFIPHCFAALKNWPITPFVDPARPFNQLLEADLVYARDFAHADSMSNEQLKHLALIVHWCYSSFDLALHCVQLLEQRQVVEPGAQQRYRQLVAALG